MMNTQVQFAGKTYVLQDQYQSLFDLKDQIAQLTGVPFRMLKLFIHCKLLTNQKFKQIDLKEKTLRLNLGLAGGKGGFGAKMKNQGSKKNKGNNTKFSRDLSGRRLDYAIIKKDCIDFYKKKIQQDKHVEEERKKYKVLEMTIEQANKSGKIDKRHKEELDQKTGDIMDAIRIGLAHKQCAKQQTHKEQTVFQKQKQHEEQLNEEQQQQLEQNQNESDQSNDQDDDEDDDQDKQQEEEKEKLSKQNQKKKKQEQDSQKQDDGEPVKKVKLSDKQQIKCQSPLLPVQKIESSRPVFLTAADKLRSLFKK